MGTKHTNIRFLLFGLALSPRTFNKCIDAALAPLRIQDIRVLNYMDDWLILAQSQEMAARHRDVVFDHMKCLELKLNSKKSMHMPVQRMTFWGVSYGIICLWLVLSQVHSGYGDQNQVRPAHHCETVSETVRTHNSCVQHNIF